MIAEAIISKRHPCKWKDWHLLITSSSKPVLPRRAIQAAHERSLDVKAHHFVSSAPALFPFTQHTSDLGPLRLCRKLVRTTRAHTHYNPQSVMPMKKESSQKLLQWPDESWRVEWKNVQLRLKLIYREKRGSKAVLHLISVRDTPLSSKTFTRPKYSHQPVFTFTTTKVHKRQRCPFPWSIKLII